MDRKILSKKQINILVKRVAQKAKEDRMPISNVFLFGSYAKGKMGAKSDLDLCFISPKFENTIEAEAYLRTKIYLLNLGLDIPIDVVAYKKKGFNMDVPLAREIKKTGIEIPLK